MKELDLSFNNPSAVIAFMVNKEVIVIYLEKDHLIEALKAIVNKEVSCSKSDTR